MYIANLGKYNEGELVGAWFTPPIDFDEVKERIGLNDEYAIHDYELPFEIEEYTDFEEINRLCSLVEELEGEGFGDVIDDLLKGSGYSLEELVENKYDIVYYPDCDSMADVAYHLVNETGMLDGIPDDITRYFDYEAYGRDLDIGGNFISTSRGIFELPV